MSLKSVFNGAKLGSMLDAPGQGGETFLTRAIRMGLSQVAADFLDIGADPNAPNAAGEYPLFIALAMKDRKAMALLLHRGASVFYKQDDLTFREAALKAGMPDIARHAEALEKERAAFVAAMGFGFHM
jgi:ankyrin repeat protein